MSTIEQTAFVDDLWVPIRIVASPIRGVFRAHPDVHAEDAPMLRPGQPVGIVDGAGGAHVVLSPHAGRLAGLLAHPGERVREGQALVWVQVSE